MNPVEGAEEERAGEEANEEEEEEEEYEEEQKVYSVEQEFDFKAFIARLE